MVETTITATGETLLMIEVRDLRIGNFVFWKGKPSYVSTLSLDIDDEYQELIYVCYAGEDSDEKGGWEQSILSDLRPIPLTADILKKSGFRESDVKGVFVIDSLKYHYDIYVTLTDAGWNFGISGHRAAGQTASIVVSLIQHLHQLQNLYHALTGEELAVTW